MSLLFLRLAQHLSLSVAADADLLCDTSAVLRGSLKTHPVIQDPLKNQNRRGLMCVLITETKKKHMVAGHNDVLRHLTFLSGFQFQIRLSMIFFSYGSTAPWGPRPPHFSTLHDHTHQTHHTR